MKKILLIVLAMSSLSSFAATSLNCNSKSYTIVVNDLESNPTANYGINGNMNDGADVEIGKMYLSDRIIALSLTVDGQVDKFEVSVTKARHGKYSGAIYSGNLPEILHCTRR